MRSRVCPGADDRGLARARRTDDKHAVAHLEDFFHLQDQLDEVFFVAVVQSVFLDLFGVLQYEAGLLHVVFVGLGVDRQFR